MKSILKKIFQNNEKYFQINKFQRFTFCFNNLNKNPSEC